MNTDEQDAPPNANEVAVQLWTIMANDRHVPEWWFNAVLPILAEYAMSIRASTHPRTE